MIGQPDAVRVVFKMKVSQSYTSYRAWQNSMN